MSAANALTHHYETSSRRGLAPVSTAVPHPGYVSRVTPALKASHNFGGNIASFSEQQFRMLTGLNRPGLDLTTGLMPTVKSWKSKQLAIVDQKIANSPAPGVKPVH